MISYTIPVLTILAPTPILLVLYKKKGFLLKPFIIGLGLLVLTLIVQPPIQYIPIQMLGIDLKNPPQDLLIPILLYAALVSGFLQEYLKYVSVRGKETAYALWVGGGFGFGETLLVAFNQSIALFVGMVFHLLLGFLAVYERFATTLYHVFSTSILAHYSRLGKGMVAYLVLAVVHSLMNFQAMVLTKLYGYTATSLLTVYGIITMIALILAIYYFKVVERG